LVARADPTMHTAHAHYIVISCVNQRRVAYGFLLTFVVNGGKIPPNSTKNIF